MAAFVQLARVTHCTLSTLFLILSVADGTNTTTPKKVTSSPQKESGGVGSNGAMVDSATCPGVKCFQPSPAKNCTSSATSSEKTTPAPTVLKGQSKGQGQEGGGVKEIGDCCPIFNCPGGAGQMTFSSFLSSGGGGAGPGGFPGPGGNDYFFQQFRQNQQNTFNGGGGPQPQQHFQGQKPQIQTQQLHSNNGKSYSTSFSYSYEMNGNRTVQGGNETQHSKKN